MRHIFFGVFICLLAALPAMAQNTGGVFPPDVNEGHKSAQYRIAANLDTDRFAQRLHYQQAINGDFMWRIVGQTRETATSDFDFDFVQAELFWQISPDENKYRTGLRFDARLRNDDRSEQLGLNWINQWDLDGGWTARLIALTAVQIGDNSADGISLSPRAHLAKKLDNGLNVGVEYYGNLGSTDKFSLDNNAQTAGPFVSTKLTGKTSVVAGVQLGLNDAAPDADLRLWVTQGF